MLTVAEARKIRTPKGKGWWMVRSLAEKNRGKRRPPITVDGLAGLAGVHPIIAKKYLEEAVRMGWFVVTDAGYQGRI